MRTIGVKSRLPPEERARGGEGKVEVKLDAMLYYEAGMGNESGKLEWECD